MPVERDPEQQRRTGSPRSVDVSLHMAGHLRGLDDRHPASINLRPTGSGSRPFSGEFFLAYTRDPASQLPPRCRERSLVARQQRRLLKK